MTKERRAVTVGFDRYGGIYLWVLFIVLFGIWSPHVFLTSATLHSVAETQSVAGILAIGVLIPLACGQYDLSVGANANLTGLVAVVAQVTWHLPAGVAVMLAVATGVAVGLINGFVVVVLKVNSFIATLGAGSILAAVQVIVTNSAQPVAPLSAAWTDMTQVFVGGFQVVVIYLVLLALAAWWFLDHTPAGRYIYATGASPEAARLSGVRVNRWAWTTLTMSGLLAGIGGVLYTSLTGPSLTFGDALLLPAYSAAFLGSTQLRPGRFNVWGTMIAIFVLATGVEGLQIVSGLQWISAMFNGVALIGAVALGVTRSRSRPKSKESAGEAPSGDDAYADAVRLGG